MQYFDETKIDPGHTVESWNSCDIEQTYVTFTNSFRYNSVNSQSTHPSYMKPLKTDERRFIMEINSL